MAFSAKTSAAVLAARFLTFTMRLLGSGGTSLPGKVALRICPDLLARLSGHFSILMVTGTNGKTTTSRMVAQLLEASGLRYRTNKSGANLASGITATVACATSLFGNPKVPWLLLEADEAAFRVTAPHLKPKAVIATNFFRDQLDRFGELYSTLNAVREGLAGTPDSLLVFNADDSLCASLGIGMDTGKAASRRLFPFGLSVSASPGSDAFSSDAAFCIRCSTRYRYSASSYGHLGHFSCPSCGYGRPTPAILCETVVAGPDSSRVRIVTNRGAYEAEIGLPGLYNVYNGLSAAALAEALSLPHDAVVKALASFERGFGRMESFQAEGRTVQIILVKNPTGFDQVLGYLETLPGPVTPAFLINDGLADGTDVSWLWDVDFERFAARFASRFEEQAADDAAFMAVSGLRADDMAVRLKYAGVPESRILICPEPDAMFLDALARTPKGGTLCLMPTYTALLALRGILAKRYGLRDFWK